MVEFKQDMPPVGGYAPIIYQRIPMKPQWNNFVKLGIFVGVTGLSWMILLNDRDKNVDNKIEMRCGSLALYPLIQAETDRMLLKQLKRNRDAEERIMKDVKGWEVGKFKGQPIFSSLPPDTYYKIHCQEYFAHSDLKYFRKAVHFEYEH